MYTRYNVTALSSSGAYANSSRESARHVLTVTPRGDAVADAPGGLDRVHAVPDPYCVTNSWETRTGGSILRFVNLPAHAIIRIYSASGVLVAVVTHDDPTGGGVATWNLHNRSGRMVASGMYFFHVETPAGQKRVGRFTVVSYAP